MRWVPLYTFFILLKSLIFHSPQASYGNEEIVQGFWFTPVIETEHSSAFLTKSMYEAISKGEMKRIPLLIGICSEEAIARAASKCIGFLKLSFRGLI